jgi:hypothetical protein
MNDFQVFGSACTYLRRYSLSSALGLVTDKDTDAGGEQVKTEPKNETKKVAIDDKRLAKAIKAISEGGYTMDELTKTFELTPEQFKTLAMKIRCSAIGKIMTNPKTKGESLSQTTKTYLQELAVEEIYGIRKEFSSRYTDKGNEVEELSIALCNDVLNLGFIYKNEEHFRTIGLQERQT